MLAILSPAKSLDFNPLPAALADLPHTDPDLAAHTADLAKVTRKLTTADIKGLMDISDKLADLNHGRFQTFGSPDSRQAAKQAALAFSGDTYIGFEAKSLSADDLSWAQDHVRILSGLYGALRPLDLIEPYRLEMGIRLKNKRGDDLYSFWKGRIGPLLDTVAGAHPVPAVINLASEEYAKAAELSRRKIRVITAAFREERDGKSRVIGLMAKRARGSMARYMVQHRLENPEDLKNFDTGGYTFQPAQSDDRTWVFSRPQP